MRQITGADSPRDVTTTDDGDKTPVRGLHHCRYYDNLVKYNPDFCGRCPHNGFRHREHDVGDPDISF